MWSNIGAAQQRGHLGLAAPSRPPAECMTITNTTAQHSLQRFTVSRALSVGLLAPVRRTRRPLAILPFPVFSGKHQPSGARSHTWTLGLTATLRSLLHTVWAETWTQVEYRRSFSRALAVSYSPYSHRVWERSQGYELLDQ